MNGYEMSYCKYLEPEASSVLSLHVFSQFFHTFLALCAAFGLSPDGAHAKTIQTSEKHAQNRGKPPKSSLSALLRVTGHSKNFERKQGHLLVEPRGMPCRFVCLERF